jgi:hypothetical protein
MTGGSPPAEGRAPRSGGDDDRVEVDLLVVADCPNRNRAARMVRGVLDELGLNEIPVPVRVVQNEAEARQRGFSGSPTVLIDGIGPRRRAA